MTKISYWVSKSLECVVGTMFLVIVLTTIAQVLFRFILNTSLVWANELAILMMIWAVWLSAAIGIYRKAHIGMTFIRDCLPILVRKSVSILIDCCVLVFLVVLGIKGMDVVQSLEGMTLVSIPLPREVMAAPAPVGAALMAFFLIPILVKDFKDCFFRT